MREFGGILVATVGLAFCCTSHLFLTGGVLGLMAGWFDGSTLLTTVAVTALIVGGSLVFFRRRKRQGRVRSVTIEPELAITQRSGPADHPELKEGGRQC